ncbi:MAG: hypothetical protein ABI877_09090 [Gemmatimonadaceae bacterium]
MAMDMMRLVIGLRSRGSRTAASHAARAGVDADLACLAPEITIVGEWAFRFVLPLVHHLVGERFDGAGPAIPLQVATCDGDLRGLISTPGREVAEPGAHAARDPDRDLAEGAVEAVVIELTVGLGKALFEWRILWV